MVACYKLESWVLWWKYNIFRQKTGFENVIFKTMTMLCRTLLVTPRTSRLQSTSCYVIKSRRYFIQPTRRLGAQRMFSHIWTFSINRRSRKTIGHLFYMLLKHYSDVIIGAIGVSNHQPYDCLLNRLRKHQSSASLAFVWGIHRWPVNSPHKAPVTQKMFPFDDVIMSNVCHLNAICEFNMECRSVSAQIGPKSLICRPVWPWWPRNWTDELK